MEYNVESFTLDHRKVVAPYIRTCCSLQGKNGDIVTKFDLRFTQPNQEFMPTDAIHGLEHLLAHYIRDEDLQVIDLSPMGCRTGFYLSVWGDIQPAKIKIALENALNRALEATEISAANEIECGNYRDLSLPGAHQFAKQVLEKGFSLNVFGENNN